VGTGDVARQAEVDRRHLAEGHVPDQEFGPPTPLVLREQARVAVARREVEGPEPPARAVVQVGDNAAGVRGDDAQGGVPAVAPLAVLDGHEVRVLAQCGRLGVVLARVQQDREVGARARGPHHDLVDLRAVRLVAAADDGGPVRAQEQSGVVGGREADGCLGTTPRR